MPTRPPLKAPPPPPSPKPNLAVTTCRPESVAVRLGPFVKGPAETTVTVYLKHVRGPSCILSGYGGLALSTDDGSEVPIVIVEEATPKAVTLTLRPGRQAVKRLRWSTKPAAGAPATEPCGPLAVILSLRLTEANVGIDVYTKSAARPEGIGAICNGGRLMHTAWQSA